jgi:hypothetical protein
MSHYGPPGGSYPGQPQDPWQPRPEEEYTQPSDPWSGHDNNWGGSPSSIPPGAPASPSPPGYDYGYGPRHDSGYVAQPAPEPAPVWTPPPPAPPKRRGSAPLVVTVILLALVVCGGLGVGGYYVLKNRDTPTGQPTTPASGDANTPKPGSSTGGAGSSTDARYANKGQCLVNKGSKEKPVMQITKCAAGTFEVLARFDGTKDYAGKCGGGKVPGYQFYYFFDSEVDTLDFVLCLKKR